MKLLLFLIGELALVTASTIWKRQAASSTGCADRDNTVTICSPEPQDIWHNGTYHEITWKYNNAIYARYDTLDLYLLDFQHNEYRTLKKWTGLQRTKGLLIQAVDDSWFPSPAPNNSPDRVYTLYLYLLASNITLERELRKLTLRESFYPAPQTLTLIQPSHNTTASISDALSANANQGYAHGLKPWTIAVIIIAILAVVLAMASLGWLIRNRYTHQRTAKYQHTNFPSIEKDHLSALPIISPFPIKSTPRKAGSDTIESYSKSTRNSVTSNSAYAAVGSLKNPSMITSKSDGDASQIAKMDVRQTSSILSSTDALLIADTFRQFMRKPEWIASEDDGKTKRRSILETDPPQERLGDQLLRKQLEEEGAQVRHVETRSRPVSGLDQIP